MKMMTAFTLALLGAILFTRARGRPRPRTPNRSSSNTAYQTRYTDTIATSDGP